MFSINTPKSTCDHIHRKVPEIVHSELRLTHDQPLILLHSIWRKPGVIDLFLTLYHTNNITQNRHCVIIRFGLPNKSRLIIQIESKDGKHIYKYA